MWTVGYKYSWRKMETAAQNRAGCSEEFSETCVKPEVMARLHLSESSPHTNTTSGPRSTESLTTDDG